MAGVEPNLVKKGGRGRLRRGVELGVQDMHADVIMAQGGRALTTTDIAAHYDAVRILAAGIMVQE